MTRFYSLVLTVISLLLVAAPAEAGKLVNWRFESSQNRLTFNTDSRVQPTAQLIPNPTRIVIDLPGTTLDQPKVNKPIGGAVNNVRIAQFDAFTTRLVIELAPGYIVDPQQVKVRGLSPTRWTVDLPTPQRITQSPSNPLPPVSTPQSNRPSQPSNPNIGTGNDGLSVTQNGILVPLERNGNNSNVQANRSPDGKSITFKLPGATLPAQLAGRTFAIQQYGAGDLAFTPGQSNPQFSLSIDPKSPGWQAYYSRLGGGIVLFPKGGIRATENLTSPPTSGETLVANSGNAALTLPPSRFAGTTISRLELTADNKQLLIRANRSIQPQGTLNRLTGAYEIRIDNAQLADNFQRPSLTPNSALRQVRLRQEDNNTVVILVEPSPGTRIGRLSRSRFDLYALEITPRAGTIFNAPRPNLATFPADNAPIAIDVPPPPNFPNTRYPRQEFPDLPSRPPVRTVPPVNLPRTSKGGRLVFIDPGHGGKDPGAIGLNGIQEKNVILPVSQYVANYLEKQGVRVVMARDSDYFVSLQGRTDMANRAGADVFVSIHANSMGKGRPDVNGLEVYYYGSSGLSSTIHRSILRTVQIKDRGVRKARFYVLRHSRMPSTLVELGFVTGYEDSQNLINPSYQQQLALAISRGILEYLQQN